MKAVWNRTDFSELEEPVVTEFAAETERRRVRRVRRGSLHNAVRSVVTVATVATALAVMPIKAHATRESFCVRYLDAAACGLESEPPLQDWFADGFDAEWSESQENALLAKIYGRVKEVTREDLEDQTVGSIYFNQQEEPSQFSSNLTPEEIRKIVKQKKLV